MAVLCQTMRWESMFADLEAQADALERAERSAEAEELARAEFAAIALTDRLRAAIGRPVRLQVMGAVVLRGRVSECGPDWVLLEEEGGGEALVRAGAVLTVAGLGRHALTTTGADAFQRRGGLRVLLRAIARDRAVVNLHLVDGNVVPARLGRVGADFVEAACDGTTDSASEVLCVPYQALAAVRRRPGG